MTKRKRCLNLDICMSFDQQITQSVPAGWPQVEIVIEILLERWRVRGFHTILNTWWLVSLTALNIMIISQSHLHLGLLNHPRCDFSKKKKKKWEIQRGLPVSVTASHTSALLTFPPLLVSLGRGKRIAGRLDIDSVQLLIPLSSQVGRTCNRLEFVDEPQFLSKLKGTGTCSVPKSRQHIYLQFESFTGND